MVMRGQCGSLLFLLLMSACGGEGDQTPTQIVLVVDSDLEAAVDPTEIDELQVTVIDPVGDRMVARAMFGAGEVRLPRTLGITNDESARLGPYTVDIRAVKNSEIIVRRRAVFTFVPNEIRRLRVFLPRACAGAVCDLGETCVEGGVCGSTEIPLEEWTGSVAPLMMQPMDSDAGM